MDSNRKYSRSLYTKILLKMINVIIDQPCERRRGYGLGLFCVTGATVCEQETHAEWPRTD